MSVAIDGMLKRHLTPEKLNALLHEELVKPEDESGNSILNHVKKYLSNLTKNEDKAR